MQLSIKHAAGSVVSDPLTLIAYLEYDNIIEITDKRTIIVNYQ